MNDVKVDIFYSPKLNKYHVRKDSKEPTLNFNESKVVSPCGWREYYTFYFVGTTKVRHPPEESNA